MLLDPLSERTPGGTKSVITIHELSFFVLECMKDGDYEARLLHVLRTVQAVEYYVPQNVPHF